MHPTRMATSGCGTSPTRRGLIPARLAGSATRASISMRRRPPRGRAVSRSAGRLGQVVHGHAIDPGCGEVLLDPLRDLARGSAAAAESAAGSEEVVDAPLRDVLLELREGRRG